MRADRPGVAQGRPNGPDPLLTATRRAQGLAAARQAQGLAAARLLEERSTHGNWYMPIDVYALCGAMYTIMLRSTGLILAPGAQDREARVLRHTITQVDPDGGFYAYKGGGSSRSMTRIAVLALRMALGRVPPGDRPAEWYAPNPCLTGDLGQRVQTALSRAEHFLRHGTPRAGQSFELIHEHLGHFLRCAARPQDVWLPMPLHQPELGALVIGSRRLAGLRRQFHHILRCILPSTVILCGLARRQQPVWGKLLALLHMVPGMRAWTERSIGVLADSIRARQNESGGWNTNSVYTMLNIMALRGAGAPMDDPAVVRACAYLQERTFDTPEGGAFLDLMGNDIWNTAFALCSYLSVPGKSAGDPGVRDSIEWLLSQQTADGAYAWASRSGVEAENDTTSVCLRALAHAERSAAGPLRDRIHTAIVAAQRFLTGRQNHDGGFSVWDNTAVRSRPGASWWVGQVLFDPPTPDVVGRILESFGDSGMTTGSRPVDRTLRYLVSQQCPSGAWWSRWWAGYLIGTCFVMRGMSSVGIRADAAGDGPARAAMGRGVGFLLRHQNADGGWGETVRSDTRPSWAGRGASTPLHTAFAVSALLRSAGPTASGGPTSSGAVRRGVRYVLDAMSADGRWHDEQNTYTIITNGCYYDYPFLNYLHPLDALTDFINAHAAGGAP